MRKQTAHISLIHYFEKYGATASDQYQEYNSMLFEKVQRIASRLVTLSIVSEMLDELSWPPHSQMYISTI